MSFKNFIKLSVIVLSFIFIFGSAFAASTSLSGPDTAKAGDTVTVTMSYSGSDTVAVGVIYSYNSGIESVSPYSMAPWPNCRMDTSQNEIGVGDYDGYDSGAWNYILNGTTTVVGFNIKIADDVNPGDVARIRLKTVYYATTANNLDQVMNQDLPTAGTSSLSITIVGDEPTATPTATDTPTPTPTSTPVASDVTKIPTPTTKVENPSTTVSSTPTPTKGVEAKPTPTVTKLPSSKDDDDFIDKTPIVPSKVVESIDENNYDSSTGGTVIGANRDDRGNTIIIEVVPTDQGTSYNEIIVHENGDIDISEITEEEVNDKLNNENNLLADDNDDSTNIEEKVEKVVTSTGPANREIDSSLDSSEKLANILASAFAVFLILVIVFVILYFAVIKRFKERGGK